MTYKNKIVRDLESVIFSPDLLKSNENIEDVLFKIPKDEIDLFLLELDKYPDDIINFIGDRKSYRLGKYFEALLKFYFIWNRKVELVANSVQVFEAKITLGEMDFILKDLNTEEYIHLEVAVKFFARNADLLSAFEYKCPDGQRNLGQKLDKTFSKQIRITDKHQTKELLKKKGIDKINKKLYIKG